MELTQVMSIVVVARTPTAEPIPSLTPTRIPPTEVFPSPTSTQVTGSLTAIVSGVIDGDTIEVLINDTEYHLRYIGIDSPESGLPFSDEATEANRQLVLGKTVLLEQDVSDTDQYDRLLRYVYLEDGTFVNAELIILGMAEAKAYPPDIKYHDTLSNLEEDARSSGLGIWAVKNAEGSEIDSSTSVVIERIFFDGIVKQVESDEYATISNVGPSPVDVTGWRLNAGAPGQDFVFPNHILEPGQSCRVYTNEDHPEHCGFSFRSREALWNNNGDCGKLFNSEGQLVDEYCY